jgi:GNAT superfamily N-acetyltransferase
LNSIKGVKAMLKEIVRYKLNGNSEEIIKPETFEKISSSFLTEKSLMAALAGHLAQSYTDGLAVLALDENENPVGYTRLQYLLTHEHPLGAWFELGSTWVAPTYRGRGISKSMYELFLPLHREKNILATTTNLAALSVGEKMNFVKIPRKELPEPVWRASCICPIEKTGVHENTNCILAWSEKRGIKEPCWFRVTQETYNRLRATK